MHQIQNKVIKVKPYSLYQLWNEFQIAYYLIRG